MDLDAFAEDDKVRSGVKSRIDLLPDEIREQILSSQAGHSIVQRWLKSEGHDGISQNMVMHWRRQRDWGQ